MYKAQEKEREYFKQEVNELEVKELGILILRVEHSYICL